MLVYSCFNILLIYTTACLFCKFVLYLLFDDVFVCWLRGRPEAVEAGLGFSALTCFASAKL